VAAESDARHLLWFDNEGANSVRPGAVAGPRHHHDVVGCDTVAAPLFAAVEDVAIAVLFCAGVDRGDVGAGLRFGNRDRGHNTAGGDKGQIFLSLLLRTEMQ
jgi:hypothetical protein